MLLSWSLASALDLINDGEVAGESPHVVSVASMRREEEDEAPPVNRYDGSLLGCDLG
jgi:hypothetical protein